MEIWRLVRGSTWTKNIKYEKAKYGFNQQQVMQCPPTLIKAQLDNRLINHTYVPSRSSLMDLYHPGADKCFVSQVSFNQKECTCGQECCYKNTSPDQANEGHLICDNKSGAGRAQKYSSETHLFYHFVYDVVPWAIACYLHNEKGENCKEYFKDRLPHCGQQYEPPAMSQCWGLSHCSTFDKSRHDFQGCGEFWYFKNELCQSQVRKKCGENEVIQSTENGTVSTSKAEWNATYQSAVAFTCQKDDPAVQIQISEDKKSIEVHINGKKFDFEQGSNSLSHEHITIEKGNDQVTVSFHNMTFKVTKNTWEGGPFLNVESMITRYVHRY